MKLYLEIGILNHIYTYENVKTKVPQIKKIMKKFFELIAQP